MSDNILLKEFILPDFDDITEDGRQRLNERTVTHKGVWRVHKSDPDKIFPSDFHADRVDMPEKLDIYTGQVFSSLTRQFLYTLPPKAMRFIYRDLSRSKEPEILNQLSQEMKFSFLN